MVGAAAKRFYKQAGFGPVEGGHGIMLDGRVIKTPAKAPLIVPFLGLAEAVAAEWEAQGETIRPETMPLTQLASTALDRVASQRGEIVANLVNFAGTDLVCYRAHEPRELAERQALVWQPMLDWLLTRFGARLQVTSGILPIAQNREDIDKLAEFVTACDDWRLAALSSITAAGGSLVLGLAMLEGRLSAEETFAASQLEETYQIELWGEEAEAAKRRALLMDDIRAAGTFLSLCSSQPTAFG